MALRREPYWSKQVEVCRSIVEYRTTVVYSGNAVGKDYLVGGIIPWWLYTRIDSLCICTGPSQTVLGSVTWKEVRRAVDSSWLKSLRVSSGIKASPALVEVAPGWQALGYSTTSVERASGQHAKSLLVIVEEASGVEKEIWDALDSLKYTRLLAIGNPLKGDGRFIDLIHQAATDRKQGIPPRRAVNAIQIPSTESPHAELEESPFGLADKTFLEVSYRHYGKDSLWVRSHIDAEIPSLDNEQLIPPEDLDRCTSDETAEVVAKLRAEGKGGRRRLGCDVGEGCGRARTVCIVKDELGILECVASRYTGPGDAAELMCKLAEKWGVAEEHTSYDGAGQTGKRLGKALEKRGLGRARAYFGSSSGGKRCTNFRTACALALARRLDPDHYYGPDSVWVPFHIPADLNWPPMREELLELRYHLAGDQSALEQKEDFMDRLGRSPDFADAMGQLWKEEAIAG